MFRAGDLDTRGHGIHDVRDVRPPFALSRKTRWPVGGKRRRCLPGLSSVSKDAPLDKNVAAVLKVGNPRQPSGSEPPR
jgi:hypothetical protein